MQKPLIGNFFEDIYKIDFKPRLTLINYTLYTLFSTLLIKSLLFSYISLFKVYLFKRFLYLLL
jgi:hypothetical protein